jgi:hypothetical protein
MAGKARTFIWVPAHVRSDYWTTTSTEIIDRDHVIDVGECSSFDVQVRVFQRYDTDHAKLSTLSIYLQSAIANSDAAFVASTVSALDIKDDASTKGAGGMPYFARSRVDLGIFNSRYWRPRLIGVTSSGSITSITGYEISVTTYDR